MRAHSDYAGVIWGSCWLFPGMRGMTGRMKAAHIAHTQQADLSGWLRSTQAHLTQRVRRQPFGGACAFSLDKVLSVAPVSFLSRGNPLRCLEADPC